MSIRRAGYRFLLSHFLPAFRKIPVKRQFITSCNENYPILVYEPWETNRRTIIAFSGFSVHGYQDERLAAVSRAFTRLGFRVVTPCIADIDQLLIRPATIDQFAAVIQAIHADSHLNPTRQSLGIFAPSYSGGVAMLASVRAAIAPRVRAICLLGAFSDFRNVLQFAIEHQEIDEYARYILLRNFLQQSRFHSDEAVELLNIAIQDNGLKRKKPLLPERLQTASITTSQFFRQLMQDTSFRSKLSYQAFEEIDHRENWMDHFNLNGKLANVNFSVSLIHGHGDRVIPSTESVQLHEALHRLGKNSQLTLTRLLDHGDLILDREFVKEVNKLASGFGFFIDSLRIPQLP
ncbi:alpha/beta hydrolase family protein [Nitrosomonas nitrosa]|mgnify:CR=1 FL=1|uniref:alpha/beta hydrolase family protein n=1 Tax=Nitrosomonas nitrosa TaxID=52442 RepID=UPI0023F7685F|nr:hypothetical protein [Nitrosomonas nitrosa]MCO6432853.1 hypothetical protein [Nitrosomonas nitrosa]